MKFPDLLNSSRERFSSKILYLLTAFLLTAYVIFSLTFIYYQSKVLKNHLVHQGQHLTEMLARSTRLGVFAENNDLLTTPVQSILHHNEVVHVTVFTDNGNQLISKKKDPGAKDEPAKETIGRWDREAFDTVNKTKTIHYTEANDKIIFWAPVFSNSLQGEEQLLNVSGPRDNRIIGYTKTVFTTAVYNRELRGAIKDSLTVPLFFMIPMWIIVFLFVEGITKPLTALTRGVMEVGAGGNVKRVPVETKDEVGKLAEAFNNMVVSLETKEAEKREVEEQLRQSQKIEAVGTLAGGVAHDFNNILNVIIGYGSLIRKKFKFDKNDAKYIENLISTAERASSITQSLLTFSRQGPINLRPLNINSIISDMESIFKRFLRHNIDLKVNLAKDDLIVLSDTGLIEQLLINLVTNAKHAMPEGGILKINTAPVKIDKSINATSGKIVPGEYAVISLIDTGTGMDKETKEKMFDPFFTTKEVGKGTGLGLSMVYGIIQQHKGFIDVETEPGKGTSLNIYLRSTYEKPRAEAEEIELSEKMRGTETILIAEDNSELRVLMEDVLNEYGYQIITAVDGDDALRKFNENIDRIDLLLLDVKMPRKNGVEVLNAVRELKPETKAIFISAYTDIKITGLSDILLQKPFQPEKLLRTVRAIIDEPLH